MSRPIRLFRIASAAAALWAVAAVVARIDRRAAIAPANALCGAALLTTYVAACFALVRLWRPRASRSQARSTVQAFALALTTLTVLEAPVLAGWIDYRTAWDRMTGNWRGPSSELQLDLERGFRHRPDQHSVGYPQGDISATFNLPIRSPRPLEFSFNARGFRGRTMPTASDVALIGDSFVEGWFVSDGETVADDLAARIDRPVANLGQSGYGAAQELIVLKRDALPLHPKLVVWFFFEGNDLYDDQAFEDSMDYATHTSGSEEEIARRMGYGVTTFRDASFTVNAFYVLRRLLDPIVPNAMPYHGEFHDETRGPVRVYFYGESTGTFGAFEEMRLGRAQATIREGKRLCDEEGVRLLLAYVPVKIRVYKDFCEFAPDSPCRSWKLWDLPQRMAEFARSSGIDFVDLTEPFRDGARAGHLLYVPQDTHWDRDGHEWAASVVESRYRALFGPAGDSAGHKTKPAPVAHRALAPYSSGSHPAS